eukprot:TRINITY_DN13635_c0_g1_i1.p1 TRINITY_DN13635_c0_g1~~TRINITY_DN13635_c0_g1_i1.p1  ORF type:complete len:213 (+),score=31.63 TRINITY_DN13635_c0_g1_i1:75-713(+)
MLSCDRLAKEKECYFRYVFFFFFNDTATTEIYTLHIVGSVRCVQETVLQQHQAVTIISQTDRIAKITPNNTANPHRASSQIGIEPDRYSFSFNKGSLQSSCTSLMLLMAFISDSQSPDEISLFFVWSLSPLYLIANGIIQNIKQPQIAPSIPITTDGLIEKIQNPTEIKAQTTLNRLNQKLLTPLLNFFSPKTILQNQDLAIQTKVGNVVES